MLKTVPILSRLPGATLPSFYKHSSLTFLLNCNVFLFLVSIVARLLGNLSSTFSPLFVIGFQPGLEVIKILEVIRFLLMMHPVCTTSASAQLFPHLTFCCSFTRSPYPHSPVLPCFCCIIRSGVYRVFRVFLSQDGKIRIC